ncbi:MAG TPA: hypothetical protein ENI34_10830 [candidate division WOR-3 bacterium]|uniref:Uncharacterized protein n=1 Tax=candidate division WOR-3 bacterium TaxID=2052148 RepID=A0A9C9EP76_UNCW3|nr:hypothetical protein [candidate division WOR-3 bacterium]
MKYFGWIISLILLIVFFITYRTHYLPLKADVTKLEKEIDMWENVLKGEKGLTGERNSFAVDRFFKDNKLTPYGEVEMLRRFGLNNKGIEIYISAPEPLNRAKDVIAFLDDQRLIYKTFTFYIVVDSIERFEYKFVK